MCKILIIDDEEFILQLVKDILTHYGHYVETAERGRKGIQLLVENDYDLVMTDI